MGRPEAREAREPQVRSHIKSYLCGQRGGQPACPRAGTLSPAGSTHPLPDGACGHPGRPLHPPLGRGFLGWCETLAGDADASQGGPLSPGHSQSSAGDRESGRAQAKHVWGWWGDPESQPCSTGGLPGTPNSHRVLVLGLYDITL